MAEEIITKAIYDALEKRVTAVEKRLKKLEDFNVMTERAKWHKAKETLESLYNYRDEI